ncbi:MAG TPA: hypothetical protein CFH78_05540 [Sulfurimonas sp. UBA10385]|nr:MAG TPA: hypothetical protein CFH78_05540 [Sulfurimonas sp. UBA10385]
MDNVVEWTKNNENFNTDFFLRYFALVNINFILNHHIFKAKIEETDTRGPFNPYQKDTTPEQAKYVNQTKIEVESEINYKFIISYIRRNDRYSNKFINNLKKEILFKDKDNGEEKEALLIFINENESLIKSLHFMYSFKLGNYSETNNQTEVKILNEINSFIETGIL